MSCRRADYFTVLDVRSNRLPSSLSSGPRLPSERAALPVPLAPQTACDHSCTAHSNSDCTSLTFFHVLNPSTCDPHLFLERFYF